MTSIVCNLNRLLLLLPVLLLACGAQPQHRHKGDKPDSTSIAAAESTTAVHKPTDYRNPDGVWPELQEGVYLNAWCAGDSVRRNGVVRQARDAGMEIVVFDVKTADGQITIRLPQRDDLLPHHVTPFIDPAAVSKRLHAQGMRAVARVVMFQDSWLAGRRADLRPHRSGGEPWTESAAHGPAWLDPSNETVRRDLLAIIDVVAASGVDEVQMDYVRFPTQGDVQNAVFAFQAEARQITDANGAQRPMKTTHASESFGREARAVADRHGVQLSADVFAIVPWGRAIDISQTGQDLRQMTRWLHRVHPMVYSSHFANDFSHRRNVHNEPYQIVFEGVRRCREMSAESCLVMPYLQAMGYGVKYTPAYLCAEIEAARNAGANGYLFWNPGSHYKDTFGWLRDYKSALK